MALIQRRKIQQTAVSGHTLPLRWAEVLMAREHKSEQLQTKEHWTCPCDACSRVRRALFAAAGGER